MKFILDDLHKTIIYNSPNTLKQIKVTSDFAQYLKNECQTEMITDMSEGIISKFTSIPIIVDDTINHKYFELVYR